MEMYISWEFMWVYNSWCMYVEHDGDEEGHVIQEDLMIHDDVLDSDQLPSTTIEPDYHDDDPDSHDDNQII